MPKVKHRHSKTRGRKRRTHDRLDAPTLMKCSQCGKAKKPHAVCLYCGYYQGTQVKRYETIEERKTKRQSKRKGT